MQIIVHSCVICMNLPIKYKIVMKCRWNQLAIIHTLEYKYKKLMIMQRA